MVLDTFFDQLIGSSLYHGHYIDLDYLGMSSHDLSSIYPEGGVQGGRSVESHQKPKLDKAICPDVFTGSFYAVCWSITNGGMMDAFSC